MTGIADRSMFTITQKDIEEAMKRASRVVSAAGGSQNYVTGMMANISGMAFGTGRIEMELNANTLLDRDSILEKPFKIIDRIGPDNQVYILEPEDTNLDRLMAAFRVQKQDMNIGDTWIPSVADTDLVKVVYVEQRAVATNEGENDLQYVCKVTDDMSLDVLIGGRRLLETKESQIEAHRSAYIKRYNDHYGTLTNHRYSSPWDRAMREFKDRLEAGSIAPETPTLAVESMAILDAQRLHIEQESANNAAKALAAAREERLTKLKIDTGVWLDKDKYPESENVKYNFKWLKDLKDKLNQGAESYFK